MSSTEPEQVEIDGDAPIALYRLYAADGVLLYVGVTHSPSARFAQHAGDKPWWPLVARRTVAWYPDRAAALCAESAAIRGESPVHNVLLSRPAVVPSTAADIEDVVLLDRAEAAAALRVSTRTIRRYGVLGLVENVKIGPREVRITGESVARLIRAGRTAA